MFAKTKAEHDSILREVLKRLSDNDMALSLEKCVFSKDTVEYLGYIVSQTGIKPLQAKLDALDRFNTPIPKGRPALLWCPKLF